MANRGKTSHNTQKTLTKLNIEMLCCLDGVKFRTSCVKNIIPLFFLLHDGFVIMMMREWFCDKIVPCKVFVREQAHNN